MHNKKIYFVSFYFPPMGRGGSIVLSNFARGLAKMGWDIEAITIENPHGFRVSFNYDYNLYDELKSKLKIHQINTFNWWGLGEALYLGGIIPCPFYNWYKSVENKIDHIINQDGIIYATCPPFSNLLIANMIKEKFKFPLIIDFRDINYTFDPFQRSRFKKIEKKIILNAHKITVATDSIGKHLEKQFRLDGNNIFTIYNGYNKSSEHKLRNDTNKSLKIIYAGTLTKLQRPDILIKAYKEILDKSSNIAENINIEFYGPKNYYYRKEISKNIEGNVMFNEYIAHDQLMNRLFEIDIGFSCLSSEKFAYATPTKVFEYIGNEIPILGAFP
ncbi:hypothetical protein JXI42_06215, partial [bacterium]|nr:hypothetical protein [bacterium]